MLNLAATGFKTNAFEENNGPDAMGIGGPELTSVFSSCSAPPGLLVCNTNRPTDIMAFNVITPLTVL